MKKRYEGGDPLEEAVDIETRLQVYFRDRDSGTLGVETRKS